MAGGLVQKIDGLWNALRACRRGRGAWATLVATGVVLSGCGGETATIRYRMIATVLVAGKVYQDSAVQQVSWTATPHSLTGFGSSVTRMGEAVVIDVGEGRSAVYVLLNNRSGSAVTPYVAARCFGIEGDPKRSWAERVDAVPVGRRCTLSPGANADIMPLVVAFKDESVPKSIFELTPQGYHDAFGVDARFGGLVLERVDAKTPIDKGIDQRLPWLNQIPFDGLVRVLDPYFDAGKLAAKDATLANKVADYFFRE